MNMLEKMEQLKTILNQFFNIQENDIKVEPYSKEFTSDVLDNHTEYIIKPKNSQRLQLKFKQDTNQFELDITLFKIKDLCKHQDEYIGILPAIVFENFDFPNIYLVDDLKNNEYICPKIIFRGCDIDLLYSAENNNVALAISFQQCNIKDIKICNTDFLKNISFQESVIANFLLSNCVFKANIYFDYCTFKNYADLHESNFMNITSFYGVKFQKVPNFSACYFKEPKAVNLVNIDIDSLDFKQVGCYIKDNFKDEWCKQKIAKNRNKEKEIKQEYRLKYAKSVKDSFRAIKDILIGQNNTLEAQKWHKLELYAEEKELEINLTLKRKQKDSSLHNNILMWFNCVMLQFYRMTSDHHTNFISILHFTIGIIVLYGLFCYLLFTFGNIEITDFELKTITLCCIGLVLLFIFFTKKNIIINLLFTVLACCVFLIFYFIVIDNKNNLLFYSLVFILSIFLYCVLFACANTIFSYLMRGCLWLGFLWVLFSFPQLNNPFIGVFSFDKSFEKENVLQQKLSDLNSSTIINLAKISQKEFVLQDDYNVSFAELNSAKIIILSNKNNITTLKDENLTKAMKILGHTLYGEILQAIKQDEIVSDIIKSTSIIYSIILLLCIFSLQKTARKNSIIPS